MKEVKTHCYFCNCRCGIIAQVKNNQIISVKGDKNCKKNNGALCVKGRAMLEFIYDPDRLKYPSKNNYGEWNRVSWDTALSDISYKLLEIKNQYGPNALAVFRGMSVYSWLIDTWLKRFTNIYGTPNFYSNSALCIAPKIYSNKYTFGPGISTCGDFHNSKCILLFGTNPAVTNMHRSFNSMSDIVFAKKNGAKLIVIDPRYTETAKKADIYTSIRPGTDLALILSLINIIIKEELFDNSFVKEHIIGFSHIKNYVSQFTPEVAEKITWVKKEKIVEIAHIFAKSKPACAERREGIFHHENATQTCRAINILNSITGNIDKPGSILLQKNLFGEDHPCFNKLIAKDKLNPATTSITRNPVTKNVPTDIIKAIIDEKPYPLKALIVIGCNPLISWPNTSLVIEALKKLQLLVVVDVYRNETATFANYALPAATFLEKVDLAAPNVAIPKVLQLQQQVIPPLYESRSEIWIIKNLANKMDYGKHFEDTEVSLIDSILNYWGLTYRILKDNDSGLTFEPMPIGTFRKNGFFTNSKKIELYSRNLECIGADPIPIYREPTYSPVSTPKLYKNFPLHLVTGQRIKSTFLSSLHNLPSLHKINPKDWIEIHPDTANHRCIKDGDLVVVSTPKGSITTEARVTDLVDPRVVFIPYGWGHCFDASWKLANSSPGECVNYLTDDELIDPLSGIPNYKSLLCEVAKK